MPNSPADVAAGAPNPQSYTDHGDGTATDIVTHLMWQQAVPAMQYTQADALSYCTRLTLAGHADWRLPTYVELVSIVDYARPGLQPGGAIDSTYFPSTPADFFWSSTTLAGSPSSAWFVNFSNGSTSDYGHYDVSSTYDVRCVCCGPTDPNAPQERYTIASGTVYDTRTKLTWQQAAPSSPYTWADAQSYCASLPLNGTGWRLPTIKELVTIVDVKNQSGVSMDGTAFPGTPPHYFWSSTPLAGMLNNAWLLDFGSGATYAFGAESLTYDVRCVR